MNDDFRDILALLLEANARFLVVGAHAMAVHGVPRATGDIDIWVHLEPSNVDRVWTALKAFGAPAESLGLDRDDLLVPGTVFQIGIPPRRIDIMNQVTGIDFDESWTDRQVHSLDGLDIPFLSREALLRNKRATDRPKDRLDVELLEEGQ